jgi:predicted amidohydrolase YtcJ
MSDGLLRARTVMAFAGSRGSDALWWREGRVVAVGSAAALDRAVPREVPRYDYPEAIVTPGFVDGHTHFLMWALGRRRVQLAGAATRDEAVARVRAAVPVQGWIVGQGWDANGWAEPPDRQVLDAVWRIPVYLDSLDVHAAWVNSAALAAAGIDRATPDPFGGRVVRDGNGEPTGLLLERAVELVAGLLPQPAPDLVDQALIEAQTEAHSLGLTGIHNVEGEPALAGFRRLEGRDRLRLRVLFHPPVTALPSLVAGGVRSGDGGAWLTIGGIKMFLDGSLGSRTAWMLQPYEGSRDRGMPITEEAEARDAMRLAAHHGLASTVHAIGDAAVRRALDLMTELPSAAVPHRIEHFQCVSERDLARAGDAGIVASMQPAHLLTDIPLVDRHWGRRGQGAYAFRSLLRRNTSLVFGSDVPVATLDPRDGVFAALERRVDGAPGGRWRSEEAIDFEAAVRAYTVAPARAAGAGRRRGTLAAGTDADLVAWALPPEPEPGDGAAFRAGRAVLTVVSGEVVMRR